MLPATAATTLPVAAVSDSIEDIIAGRVVNLGLPWPLLEELAQPFAPASKTVLAAPGGASKTFMTLQAIAFWIDAGVKVCVLELERSRTFHLMRALAQRTGIAAVTKTAWVRENAAQVRGLLREHADFVNRMGLAIHTAPRSFTTRDAARWFKDRAAEGYRLGAIDPASGLRRCGDIWTADDRLLEEADDIATSSGMSLLFVLHPRKGGGHTPDLDSLAGGAAWSRFADNVIWLENHEPRESTIRTCCGSDTVTHNRTLHLLKTRSGEGTGLRIAYEFNVAEGLILKELGVLAKTKRRK